MNEHSASQSTGTMVASGVVTSLAAICVALRFYVRVHIKAGLAWDDWWILIGLLTTLLTGGLLIWGTLPSNAPGAVLQLIYTSRRHRGS
jgi:formate hydrogenlyase subunit 3/multisubunit Na+/H+ antiporter MnhD subunit